MNECLTALIFALAATALARLISFSGENERWVRFALGAVLSAAVATIVVDTVGGISLTADFLTPEYEYTNDAYGRTLEDAFCEGVANSVSESCSLKRGEVSVSVLDFDPASVSAEKITVELSGRAAGGDARSVRAYVEKNFGECEVILRFE